MTKLPTQLPWGAFKAVLKSLGYEEMKSKGGSARCFHNPKRNPQLVTFHEPHGGDSLRQGTLREYLRKLHLDREEFFKLLE